MQRAVFSLLGLVLLLPAGGALVQGVASALDRMRLVPPGEFVAAGGARLHVFCSGPMDAPPVFLETGMGIVSDAWTHVQKDLSDDHRVCRYDRAGTGHSEPLDGPKDAGTTADRLAALADAVGIRGPMILVGHSYGGLVARVFADRFAHRVAGLVLVDSAHQEMGNRLPLAGQEMVDDILSALEILSVVNHFGVMRIVGAPAPWMDGLEGAARDHAAATYASASHMKAAAEEVAAWRDGTSTDLAQSIGSLGSLPMIVLVADEYPHGLTTHWIALQHELARLSDRGQVIVVSGADHYGLVQRPEYARQVATEIRSLALSIDW